MRGGATGPQRRLARLKPGGTVSPAANRSETAGSRDQRRTGRACQTGPAMVSTRAGLEVVGRRAGGRWSAGGRGKRSAGERARDGHPVRPARRARRGHRWRTAQGQRGVRTAGTARRRRGRAPREFQPAPLHRARTVSLPESRPPGQSAARTVGQLACESSGLVPVGSLRIGRRAGTGDYRSRC